jgi:hypothetical protein
MNQGLRLQVEQYEPHQPGLERKRPRLLRPATGTVALQSSPGDYGLSIVLLLEFAPSIRVFAVFK